MLPEKLTDMMKNQSLTLKAVLENNGIRISIKSANDPMYSWSEKKLEISHLSHHCNQLIETLNKSRREEYSSEISKDLKSMGYLMADDLLPVDFKDILRKTHAESLILDLDEKLVHIPWEHICIDDELLCQKFSMGRFIETRQKKINFETREIKTPYHMWVLVNPQFDLENADSEGDSICRLMDQTNYRYKKEIIKASLNTDIHIDTFKSQIRHYDFIHFAGHGLYQNEQPDSCGLILSHGTVSTSDIKAMEGSGAMPLLIFSNACQSARTGEMNHMPFGLAHSFIRSGVRHYIGTFWKIFDAPGSQFATMFYQNLLSGHSIGKALKLTRIHFCEKYNPDMWASYVLYVLKELKTLLRDKYPLRGMISEVKGNQIKLNIGFDQGVRVGQVFSIKDHSCQLSILEVYQSESISNFTQTECSLQSEKQVFLSENDKN
jgi:CHAT domain-containing protein